MYHLDTKIGIGFVNVVDDDASYSHDDTDGVDDTLRYA